jgi:hypothetical protein
LINPNKKRGISIKVQEGYNEVIQESKPRTGNRFASHNERRINDV